MNRRTTPSIARTPAPALIAVFAAASLTLSGCSSPGGSTAKTTTGSSSANTSVSTQSSTSATTTSPTTSSTADSAGTTATASGPFCSRFTATEVGAVVGATVTAGTDIAGRCTFTSGGLTATLLELPPTAAANGGLSGAKAGASAGIRGTARDIAGLGDSAFVDSGTAAGSALAEGGVQVNGQVVEATIRNASSTPDALGAQVEALLRLAATKA